MAKAAPDKGGQARQRRGSIPGSGPVSANALPAADAFKDCWDEHMVAFCYGKLEGHQAAASERGKVWSPATEESFNAALRGVANQVPPTISCLKGCKGVGDKSPNQDNFSYAYFKNGWAIACCMDGHGPFGHLVATRCVQTVPYYLSASKHFPDNMPLALKEAYEWAQKDCVALARSDNWDIQTSGATAVTCAWKDGKLYSAHCGDARLAVGSETRGNLLFATADHKPDTPAEAERIRRCGGEVRSQTYPDGWTAHRIFIKGQDVPGLAMARTLGDDSVKAHGVTAEPEVHEFNLNLAESPFIVLASDGVWEFLESEFVVKAMAKKLAIDGPEKSVVKLGRESRKRWKEEEGDYCDDITAVLIQLNPAASKLRGA